MFLNLKGFLLFTFPFAVLVFGAAIIALIAASLSLCVNCKGFKYLWLVSLGAILLSAASFPINFAIKADRENKKNLEQASFEIVLNQLKDDSRDPYLECSGKIYESKTIKINVVDELREFYNVILDLDIKQTTNKKDLTPDNGYINWYNAYGETNNTSYGIYIYPSGIIKTSKTVNNTKLSSLNPEYHVYYKYDASQFELLLNQAQAICTINHLVS